MPSLPSAASEPAPARPDPTSRSAWHRRASRPVMGWMAALVVLALVHRWVPQARWLLVHIVTLGLLTTSVMIWAQHFADGLLKTRADDATRRRQVQRIHGLTLAIIVTATGMVGAWPVVTTIGAAGVAAMIGWFALSLVHQLRSALPSRFAVVVRGYAIAAGMLVIGAGFGAALAFSPPPLWQGRLLLAHQSANLLGFIGTTALVTLVTLGPTVLRVKVPPRLEATLRWTGAVVPAGALVAVTGALLGAPALSAAGVLAVAAMGFAVLIGLIGAMRAAHWRTLPLYPPLALPTALLWLIGTLLVATGMLIAAQAAGTELTEADLQRLTVPFVGGFGLQLLLGAMSFLMPTVMGGGPRAVRASLAELSRGAVLRVVLYNLALGIYLLADGSWTRVLASLLAAGAMVAFLPLTIRGVRASLRVRREGPVAVGMPGAPPRAADGVRARADADRPGVDRRSVGTGAALGLAGALGVLAAGQALDRGGSSPSPAGQDVPATGRTVRASIRATADMRFEPDHVQAAPGDRVVIEVRNEDPTTEHDLLLASGETTGRIAPGATGTLTVDRASTTTEGWCTIVGHRGMGMLLTLEVTGVPAEQPAATAAAGTEVPAPVDLAQPPSADFVTRDATLPPAATPEVSFEVTSALQEVAPGRRLQAMTYNGRVMGPILRGELGGALTVHLTNHADMGHSLDLHAGTVSPDPVMRTIAPGQSLDYPIRTDHAGIWLYHCSTMPMSVHLASGMFGALVVPPAGLAPVDHEWVIVQSEGYLGADGEEVDADAIRSEHPTVILWNGHANQYVHDPLRARAGERARIWVLAAGPSRGMSFHVVGGVFDTVFAEGAYRLRAEDAEGGGSQALGLSAAQGGFVELTFAEPGTYTAVSHSFVDMERGARALIVVE